MYCAEFMIRVSHDGNPIIYNKYTEIKYTKHLNNALHQNANITKRARYAIFALSIVDDSFLLQHYFINGTQSNTLAAIDHQRAIPIKYHDHS